MLPVPSFSFLLYLSSVLLFCCSGWYASRGAPLAAELAIEGFCREVWMASAS